jgi:hypothetical protein
MPDENIAQSRRIVLSGLAAGVLAPDTAISFVDDAGNTVQRAVVDVDGSCEVHENALSSAQEVHVGPINVSLRAQQLRALIDTQNTLDVAALLRAGFVPEAPVKKRGIAGGKVAIPPADMHKWEHDPKDR